ncbi:hypothetical protein [Providencia stuartii]|uniref:hypothetical protein n=1 Tax=Providencia stuartii TaxID=588 RepID=UPI00300C70BB
MLQQEGQDKRQIVEIERAGATFFRLICSDFIARECILFASTLLSFFVSYVTSGLVLYWMPMAAFF